MVSLSLWGPELFHIALIAWNMASDIILYLEMKTLHSQFNEYSSVINSAPNGYRFEFCYPSGFTPEWFDIVNVTMLMDTYQCECENISAKCNDNGNVIIGTSHRHNSWDEINFNATMFDDSNVYEYIHKYVSCDTNIWASNDDYYQILTIVNWDCTNCNCENSSMTEFNSDSLIMQQLFYQYDSFVSTSNGKMEYCDSYSMVSMANNNEIKSIEQVCLAFIVIGYFVAWIGVGMRVVAIRKAAREYLPEGSEDTKDEDFVAVTTCLKMCIQFFVSPFLDIPQTIIALYYVKYLYTDKGFYCFENFVHELPSQRRVQQTKINGYDSLIVIIAKNWKILMSLAASISMVAFNGVYSGYLLIKSRAKNVFAHMQGWNNRVKIVEFLVELLIFVCVYIVLLWTPTMGVLYHVIAPAFYKTWEVANVLFIIGCVCWGILSCCLAGGCWVDRDHRNNGDDLAAYILSN